MKATHLAPVALLALVAGGFAACDGPQDHVLPGNLYEVAGNCLDPTSSIDFVPGPDPGNCPTPTCVVTPAGANGAPVGVYVTTECGPFPPLDITWDGTPGSGPPPAWCPAALAAYALYVADGGSPCELYAADASDDGDGAEETGDEAGDASQGDAGQD